MKVKYRLGDIASISAGQSAPQNESDFSSEGIPFVRAGSLQKLIDGNAEHNVCELINEDTAKQYCLRLFPKNTILFAKSGKSTSKGYVHILSQECYVVNHIACVNMVKDNSNYMKYYFMYHKPNKLVKDDAYPSISLSDIGNMNVNIHDIQTQKEIVAVLDKVTTLISRRKEQLDKLDILIKSKFNEMFGDPVLNPKGWEKKKLGEVCSSIVRGPFGSALKKEYFVPYDTSVYKVYEQKNAIKQDFNIGSYYISKEKFLSLKRFECKTGDIIMSCSGTVGKMYTLPKNAHKGLINQALMKITLSEIMIDKIFKIYFGLAVDNLVLNGSGIKNISSVSYLKNIEIPIPPLDLQNQFAEFVKQVEKNKEKVKSSLNQLETLYSALMQEYFG